MIRRYRGNGGARGRRPVGEAVSFPIVQKGEANSFPYRSDQSRPDSVKFFLALLITMFVATKVHAQLKTVEERVAEFGAIVQERLEPQFRAAGIPYPPRAVVLIGIKQDRVLEVHAADADGVFD